MTGYADNATHRYNYVFHIDSIYNDTRVYPRAASDPAYQLYKSGAGTDVTVHIGNNQGTVLFDIGEGAEIDYFTGSGETHYTRAEMLFTVLYYIQYYDKCR